jgi:hypothetical protein
MYHTNIKEKNRSIFNGTMTEEEMQHAHPLEYRRILAAHELWQRIGDGGDGRGEHQAAAGIVSEATGHRPS